MNQGLAVIGSAVKFVGMDSIIFFLIRQDLQDYQDKILSSSISGRN